MSRRDHIVIAAAAAVAASAITVVVSPQVASADVTGWDWRSAGVLQQGSLQNAVGFWQTLGVDMSKGGPLCPGSYYDGIFGAKTVGLTKRIQTDIAGVTPTGVVSLSTWYATQNSHAPGGFLRLGRISGTDNGDFSFYNGTSEAALYWQGSTGTHLWKFSPPGAGTYINATTARTMGSYSAC